MQGEPGAVKRLGKFDLGQAKKLGNVIGLQRVQQKKGERAAAGLGQSMKSGLHHLRGGAGNDLDRVRGQLFANGTDGGGALRSGFQGAAAHPLEQDHRDLLVVGSSRRFLDGSLESVEDDLSSKLHVPHEHGGEAVEGKFPGVSVSHLKP